MKKRSLLCFFLPLQLMLSHAELSHADDQAPVVGAYYENWSQYRQREDVGWRPQFFPSLIDPTTITDLYYAFAFFGYVTKSVDPNNPHNRGRLQDATGRVE